MSKTKLIAEKFLLKNKNKKIKICIKNYELKT